MSERSVCMYPGCHEECEPDSNYCRAHEGGMVVVVGRPKKDGPGVKHDAGKMRMDQWKLLPPRATDAVVRVLVFGVKKYSAWGWQKVPGWRWRYTAALLRHVFAYARGETRDPETGEHHLAHAGCCLLFMLDNELRLAAGHRDVPDGDTEEVPR